MPPHKILFRCDSSQKIGTGHVMRCLVLAKQFRAAGSQVSFICHAYQGNINFRILEAGFKIHILAEQSHQEDLKDLCQLINVEAAKLLCIDHYDYSSEEESLIKQQTQGKILVLDDLLLHHQCDFVLNHGIGALPQQYSTLVPDNCKLYVGAQYFLLRDEFKAQMSNITVSQRAKPRLLVTLGGGDPNGVNDVLIKLLNQLPTPLAIDYVLTSSNEDRMQLIEQLDSGKHNVNTHIDCSNMSILMAQASCAIIAGGGTLIECLYMRLLTIAIQLTDNQSKNIKFLKQQKIGFVIDNYPAELNYNTIHHYLTEMFAQKANQEYRKKIDAILPQCPLNVPNLILSELNE